MLLTFLSFYTTKISRFYLYAKTMLKKMLIQTNYFNRLLNNKNFINEDLHNNLSHCYFVASYSYRYLNV